MNGNLELRNKLLPFLGYTEHEHPGGGDPYWTHKSSRDSIYEHPIPNTLDAIAEAMPAGWVWTRTSDRRWGAMNHGFIGGLYVEVHDTGDEKADRIKLAIAAWQREKRDVGH